MLQRVNVALLLAAASFFFRAKVFSISISLSPPLILRCSMGLIPMRNSEGFFTQRIQPSKMAHIRCLSSSAPLASLSSSGSLQLVFGPASDGGYYLVGLTALQPALFKVRRMRFNHRERCVRAERTGGAEERCNQAMCVQRWSSLLSGWSNELCALAVRLGSAGEQRD